MNKLAQAEAIVGLVTVFVVLVVIAVLMEPLTTVIEVATNASDSPALDLVLDLIPIAVVLMGIILIFSFTRLGTGGA